MKMSKGKKKVTLEFSRWDLTDEQFAWFGAHGLQGIDYESCSMSPLELADSEEPVYPIGFKLDEDGCIPEDAFETYMPYPSSFWKELGLPAKVKKEIIAFWTLHPDGEVEWTG
jgi:hypothetical protein